MTEFSSLQAKVDALKVIVAMNSISPLYLGSLLDDFIALLTAISNSEATDVANLSAAIESVRAQIPKIVEVEDEDAMAQMIANGETDSKTLYYIPE